jgi:Putative DNA-binding domain
MLARLQPSECKISETYWFSHEVGERRVEYDHGDGEISLTYQCDADVCPDLKPADTGAHAKNQATSQSARIEAGFISINNSPTARAIELHTENLADSINRVDRCCKSYRYRLEEPPLIPLRIEAKILDEPKNPGASSRFFEAHQFSDGLHMILTLTVSLPPERLRAPARLYRDLQNILLGKRRENCVMMSPAEYRNRDVIARKLSALANNRGGILLFGISGPDTVTGIEEAEIPELATLLESVALTLEPPLAIAAPSHFTIDEKHVLISEVPQAIVENVVSSSSSFLFGGHAYGFDASRTQVAPIPATLNHHAAYDPRRSVQSGRHLTAEEVDRETKKGVSGSSVFLGSDLDDLLEFQAALANSGGGRIFFGVHNQGPGVPGEITGFGSGDADPVDRIARASHLWVPRSKPYGVDVNGKTVYVQDIASAAPDLYRGAKGFFKLTASGRQELQDRDAIAILRDRKGPVSSILTSPTPLLRRLALDWIDFPSGSDIYNPEGGRIEWRDTPFKIDKSKRGSFTCTLHAPITRAKELLGREVIPGEVDIEIRDFGIARIPVRMYDALGYQSSPDWQIITRLKSHIRVSLQPILQDRSYYPVRSVEILGIEPRPERFREIIRMLNDNGIILDDGDRGASYPSTSSGFEFVARKQGGSGSTRIHCQISGTPSTVNRRFTRGRQIDNKKLISGSITVRFQAETDEGHQTVVNLLNEVIANLHRRFDYLRVE